MLSRTAARRRRGLLRRRDMPLQGNHGPHFDPDDDRDSALVRLLTMLGTALIRAGANGSEFDYAVYKRR